MKDEQHPGGWDDLRIDRASGDSAALSRLLAAAAAPGSPPELAGEDAALAAFRAAAPAPAEEGAVPDGPLPGHAAGGPGTGAGGRARGSGLRLARRPGRGRPIGKRAVKIAVAVCALLSAGGVAVAAGTGTLPGTEPSRPPATRSPAPAQQDGRLAPAPGGGAPSRQGPATGPSGTGGATPGSTPKPPSGEEHGKGKDKDKDGHGKEKDRGHKGGRHKGGHDDRDDGRPGNGHGRPQGPKKPKHTDKPGKPDKPDRQPTAKPLKTSRPKTENGRGPRPSEPRPSRRNAAPSGAASPAAR
ncbi:hypothetical protein ACIBF1_03560 [Spirillospora sp. NPDC050679]